MGEAGQKQLMEVREEGERGGLATFFGKKKDFATAVLGEDGLPPMPAELSSVPRGKRYELLQDQTYGDR